MKKILRMLKRRKKKIEKNEEQIEEKEIEEEHRGRSSERETNESRLAQREKQIRIGKNTEAYKRYSQITAAQSPLSKRRLKTPDKYQICSKRSWDGQIIKWRKSLHKYDPPTSKVTNNDQETKQEPVSKN